MYIQTQRNHRKQKKYTEFLNKYQDKRKRVGFLTRGAAVSAVSRINFYLFFSAAPVKGIRLNCVCGGEVKLRPTSMHELIVVR